MGCYFSFFGWIIHLVFWSLLWSGRDELEPRWTWGLALLWLGGWWGSSLVPGGAHFFMPLVAMVDVGLVLAVLGGDVRIT